MGRTMGVVFGIIGIAIVMIIFPLIMDSTHDVQADTDVDTFAAVTTGAGVYEADVVLTEDLYNDDNSYVTSVTSDNGGDTPVAGTYVAGTNTLTVTGLAESDTRDLTVTYEYGALDNYTGMDAIVGMTPLLIWVAILAMLGAGTWFAMKGKG